VDIRVTPKPDPKDKPPPDREGARSFTFTVKESMPCGPKDPDNPKVTVNHHIHLTYEGQTGDWSNMQSPLFRGILPGSRVVITVTPPPPKTDTPKTVVPSAKMLPGLLAYWPFDEGEGDTPADVSGGVRGKGHNIEWVDGVRGKAIRVKGKGSHFDFSAHPKVSFAAGADFTFCGWVRTRQKDGTVLSNRTDADGTPAIDLQLNSGVLGLGVRQQGATDYIASLKGAKVISDGAWHHFAFTRHGADVALYLDGTLQARQQKTRSGGAIPTNLRALGAELYWQKVDPGPTKVPDVAYFAGDFDEFCVFGRALSAAEIRTLAGKKAPE
jgi:hypothetical protein